MTEVSDDELVVRLRVAIGRIARQLRQNQAGGLTVTQLSALVTLEQRGPLRLTDLAAVEGITPSTLSRIVAPLEERGFLVRTTDPADRRSSFVAVSDRALDELTRMRMERNVVLARRLAALDAPARDALAAALPALEQLTAGREEAAAPDSAGPLGERIAPDPPRGPDGVARAGAGRADDRAVGSVARAAGPPVQPSSSQSAIRR